MAKPPQLPPNKPPPWPIPTFSLRIDDLAHPGTDLFLHTAGPPLAALRAAVVASFTWLYTPEHHPTNVKEVVLILRPMEGVAYTTGTHERKEIHFSLNHIVNSKDRAHDEIHGVLTHEVVHCYQNNGDGKAPGGLIEGFADWVRLRAGLAPLHWNANPGDKWDAGYQATAYFLDWIEGRYGDGTLRELNGKLAQRYDEKTIWTDLTGRTIKKLWKIYCAEKGKGVGGGGRTLWDDTVRYLHIHNS